MKRQKVFVPIFIMSVKQIFCLFFYFVCIPLFAQNNVDFKVQKDGTFKTEDGSNYVVIAYEGKTASELYSMIKGNVLKTFNSAKDVLSENPPHSLSIRAISKVAADFSSLFDISYEASWNLDVHFKDGKIRIDAPEVDSRNNMSHAGCTFAKSIYRRFDKNGNVKKKYKRSIKYTEDHFNSLINSLLKEKDNEEW